METKYYTPNIEEFHVGFEFEGLITERGHQSWSLNDNLTANKLSDIILWLSEEKDHPRYEEVRVKYLDREDIESLGFNTEDNGTCYNMEKGFDIYGLYPLEDNLIEICKFTNTLFKGMVKNKSELKMILKMLNIE
jgi:hypothetical protein